MPILHVEIITQPDEHFPPTLSLELANRTGEIFGSTPGNTWVIVHFTSSENYAENNSASEDIFPVFVSVLKNELPSRDSLQAEVAQLTPVIALICNRPEENVHIIYLPKAAGRVAFGGRVLPS